MQNKLIAEEKSTKKRTERKKVLSTLQLYSLCSKLLTFISLHFCSFSIFHSLVSELITTISFINEWIIGNERKCKKWMFRVWSPGMRQKKNAIRHYTLLLGLSGWGEPSCSSWTVWAEEFFRKSAVNSLKAAEDI